MGGMKLLLIDEFLGSNSNQATNRSAQQLQVRPAAVDIDDGDYTIQKLRIMWPQGCSGSTASRSNGFSATAGVDDLELSARKLFGRACEPARRF